MAEAVKVKRYDQLMKLQRSVQKKSLSRIVGTTRKVMIDGLAEVTKAGRVYRGRHSGQAPDIDGMTYVLSPQDLITGEIYPVAISKMIGDYDLMGSVEVAVIQGHCRTK